ncbi:MAG: GNAT family N-acetyltransferase [Rhabdochlamydiaceae bacterium]|nr:GNAT family N-acetyltransferase [Candidatus Amphrikana amoebophyrae]
MAKADLQLITDDPRYSIRYTRVLDKGALVNWIKAPEVLRWFPMEGDKEIELCLRNWIGFSRFQCSLTATFDHTPIGIATLYLMPYKKVAHLAMVNIVVSPNMQKKGVGTSLVRNIVHLAKTKFKLTSIHFEVMEGCDLIPILEKQGFVQVFRQSSFYTVFGDDVARIVMEVQL